MGLQECEWPCSLLMYSFIHPLPLFLLLYLLWQHPAVKPAPYQALPCPQQDFPLSGNVEWKSVVHNWDKESTSFILVVFSPEFYFKYFPPIPNSWEGEYGCVWSFMLSLSFHLFRLAEPPDVGGYGILQNQRYQQRCWFVPALEPCELVHCPFLPQVLLNGWMVSAFSQLWTKILKVSCNSNDFDSLHLADTTDNILLLSREVENYRERVSRRVSNSFCLYQQ